MVSAFIDQGSEFEGKLSFRDTVRIDGIFRGEIRSQNTLVVGETGEIEAEVFSGQVEVSGSLIGNVIAQESIVLHKTARVQGDLSAPSCVIEEGAVLNGRVDMKSPAELSPATKIRVTEEAERGKADSGFDSDSRLESTPSEV
jgi:cytoskeletal protein CcmA (bactofilin family)